MALPDGVQDVSENIERFSPSPEEQEAAINRPLRENLPVDPDWTRPQTSD